MLGLLLLTLILSWILTIAYLFRLDATISDFVMREIRAQDAWSRHFPPSAGARIVVTGGSSCTFSIDGETATKTFGVPVINGGLEAGIEAPGIYLEASRLVKPGDTLVLALEPSLYDAGAVYSQEALQVLVFQLNVGLISRSRQITGLPISLGSLLFAPRPGLEAFSAFLGRSVTRTPFRYSNARIKPGGLMVTDLRLPLPIALEPSVVSAASRDVLLHFRDWASQHGVHVVYSLPWLYVDAQDAAQQRRANAQFASEMLRIIPVIHEEELGVKADRSFFADTPWHLTEATAQIRTKGLIARVLAHDYWTVDALAKAAAQP